MMDYFFIGDDHRQWLAHSKYPVVSRDLVAQYSHLDVPNFDLVECLFLGNRAHII